MVLKTGFSKVISAFSVFFIIITSGVFSTVSSSALDCAVFTGETPSQEFSSVNEGAPAIQEGTQVEPVIVDIAPVSRMISANESLPPLNCFSTSNSGAIFSAPICSILDQFGNVISQTPKPGTYTIVCEGGGILPGYTPNYGTGILTVNASLSSPQATSGPNPTPSPSVSTNSANINPIVIPSPTALPSPTSSANAQPNLDDLPIDTSVPLRVTGALQSCSTYTTTREELALLSANVEFTSESATATTGGETRNGIIEIGSSDYQIYENMKLPKFDCTVADQQSKVLTAPTCSAYDGESRISVTPKPGIYLIRCQGGEYVPGFDATFRIASFSVLTLPRITNQMQPTKAPSPSATPTDQPSARPSADSQPTGQAAAPTSRPTANPRPTPTVAASRTPIAQKIAQSPLQVTTLNSAISLLVGSTNQLFVTGGSGSGQTTFTSATPQNCSVSLDGIVTALKVGECRISISKEADSNYLISTPASTVFAIISGTTPSLAPQPKSTTKSNKSSNTKKAPVTLNARDFIITLDPRLQVNGTKLQISGSASNLGTSTTKITTLQFRGLDRSYSYSVNLVFPNGSGIELSNSFSKDSILTTQYFQLLRQGTYKVLLRRIGEQNARLITLKVS